MNCLTFMSCATLLIGLQCGCAKHSPEKLPDDPIPVATLEITSPAAGSIYVNGDSVSITAKGISTEEIHGYNIEIKKLNDATVYYTEFIHEHNDTIVVDKKWQNTLTAATDLQLEISLLLDHDGHTLVKKVNFKSQ